MKRFRPLAYGVAVIVGIILGGGIAVQAVANAPPSALSTIGSLLFVFPAWALFLPGTLWSLNFMEKRGWSSVLHHCLMGSLSASATVFMTLVISWAAYGFPVPPGFLKSVMWYMLAGAVGGMAAGYVYWAADTEGASRK